MFSISAYEPPSRKELRSFGLILAAGFFVIAMFPTVLRHVEPRRPALAISIVFALAGIVIPQVLRPVHRVWMFIGNILGWINSRIILSLIFYLVVTPVRIAMSVTRKDPMNRTFDGSAETYRVVRKAREPSHMKHQF